MKTPKYHIPVRKTNRLVPVSKNGLDCRRIHSLHSDHFQLTAAFTDDCAFLEILNPIIPTKRLTFWGNIKYHLRRK